MGEGWGFGGKGDQKAKMGPLVRDNPYYKNYYGRVKAFFFLFWPYLDIDVSTVCSTGLSLISLNSLDDVDNVSQPTTPSSSSLSEPKVEVS